jgi:outer membrane protein W
MKVFQLKLFYNKSATLKKKVFLTVVLLCLFNLNAQEKSNITLRIEPGVLIENNSDNLGLLLNIEPKVKISENAVIGLRFGIALNSQKFENIDRSQFLIDNLDDYGVVSFIPSFDYYLNENKYRPYIGLGLGYYLFFDDLDVLTPNGSIEVLKGSTKNQVGFLLRGGFEVGKTRVGLEYNLIPKADIKMPNGQIIGTVDNSYFGLSIGFTIGGGKSYK